MRFFPGATAQRAVLAVLASIVMAGALALPLANAADDDLKDRQKSVQSRIDKVSKDLEHASSELQAATRKVSKAQTSLHGAQTQLETARGVLSNTRVRLAKARELDRTMQARLVTATEALATARAELAEGRAAVAAQQAAVADEVVTNYEQGDPRLRAISSLLHAEDLEDVTRSMAAEDAILAQGARVYADLRVAEEALATKKEKVQEAKAAVKVQREEAAANLVAIDQLYDEAVAAKESVRAMVSEKREAKQAAQGARQAAYAAREADRRALAELEQREARIKQLILASASKESASFNGSTGGLLNYPVNGPITSPYGYRTHPIYGYYGLHNGTDFGAGCGASLYAAANGTVVQRYTDSVYGNRLYLNIGRVNGANLTLVYNHATGYNVGVGTKVRRGQVIGSVGSTGWSTGCHLHFTVLRDGNPVNPENYL